MNNIFQEILLGLQIVVQLLPIIEQAINLFGSSQAATDMVLSAIPVTTPPRATAHITGWVKKHMADRALADKAAIATLAA